MKSAKAFPILSLLSLSLFSCAQSATAASSSFSSAPAISSSLHVHSPIAIASIPATCTSPGQEGGTQCATCGQILEPPTVLPAGHDFRLASLSFDASVIARQGLFACSRCGEKATRSIESKDLGGMAILELTGDVSTISKENKVTVLAKYQKEDFSFESEATLKYQGSSSLAYPKKNYNIQFLDEEGSKRKIALQEDWGEQSKYTLKANWVDASASRNIVSGRIYSQIVHSRQLDDEIGALPNAGAVDGYPCLLYLNGSYEGLYTVNIPKDNWMFGMKGSKKKQALVSGNAHSLCANLEEPINASWSNGMELEYSSDDDESWVRESMNGLMAYLGSVSDADFPSTIADHVWLERSIDSMLYSMFICAADNFAKNILWATYDGTKWFPSVYDMDGTWGMMYHGESYYSSSAFLPDEVMRQYNANLLWKKIYQNEFPALRRRYKALRTRILTEENIEAQFSAFLDEIPSCVREAELQRWPSIPAPEKNNLEQITSWSKERLANYDAFFAE